MSQDSQGIKTIEQWRWSDMQGLELVSDPPPPPPPSASPSPSDPSFKTNPTIATDTTRVRDQPMESSAEPSYGGEKPEAVPSVGFGQVFRFADGLDYVLMGIGSVGAIVHGCSLPIFLRFFADLVNSFGANANDMDKMMQEVLKVVLQFQ